MTAQKALWEKNMKIGIPKKGDFRSGFQQLLREVDIETCWDFPLSLRIVFARSPVLSEGFLLKPRRIPVLVESGALDFGIVGEDIVRELDSDVVALADLSCPRLKLISTRVVVFGTYDESVPCIKDIPSGSEILAEYPRLARKAFGRRVGIRIVPSPGGSEAEVPLAYRFGAAVVETGHTLRMNRLREIETIFRSKPILIANKKALTCRGVTKWVSAIETAVRS